MGPRFRDTGDVVRWNSSSCAKRYSHVAEWLASIYVWGWNLWIMLYALIYLLYRTRRNQALLQSTRLLKSQNAPFVVFKSPLSYLDKKEPMLCYSGCDIRISEDKVVQRMSSLVGLLSKSRNLKWSQIPNSTVFPILTPKFTKMVLLATNGIVWVSTTRYH
jgi:hypothetical protein